MKILRIIICGFGIFFFSNCTKFLETPPDLRTELDSYDKIAELLTTAYPKGNYIPFFEVASDNAGDKGIGRTEGDITNIHPWMYKDVDSRDMDSPTFYWYACYAAISAANHALEAIDKLGNKKEYNPLKGEALIARAYAHHMLAMTFAKNYDPKTAASDPGIPYVTETEKVVLKKYERKTVEHVYQQIEKDIVEGLPLLDNSRYKVPKFHFTTTSANAFAARFYLFKGDYAKVVKHAELALGQDIKSYIRPINSVKHISMEYFTKQEWYTSTENPSNLLICETPSLWGRSYVGNRYGFTSTIYYNLFLAPNITTGRYIYSFFGATETVIHIPKFREHFVTTNVNASFGVPYNMLPLFTADELLLNWAEGLTKLRRFNEAINLLNTFISHKVIYNSEILRYVSDIHDLNVTKINNFYGDQDLEQNLIKTILRFKQIEFVFEGLRWMDVLRHRIPVQHWSYNGNESYILDPGSNNRMFQLPDEVILSGIEPNPR